MAVLAREVAAGAAIFFLLYNISFKAAPAVTTGRIVLVVLLIVGGRRLIAHLAGVARRQALWVAWLAGLVAYSVLLWYFSGRADVTQTSRLVNFGIFVLFAPVVVLATCTPSLERFLRAMTLATTAQAGFVFLAYLSPAFRAWTADLLVQGGNIPLTTAQQVAGFSNSAGAAQSVVQSLGVFCAVYRFRVASSVRESACYLSAALLVGASAILVGRTGVLLSAAFLATGVLASLRVRHLVTTAGILGIVATAVTFGSDGLIERAYRVNPAVGDTIVWSLGAFVRLANDPSVEELAGTPIPPLSLRTLLGTGLVTVNGANAAGHDSGYVQTYFALGLAASVMFYGGLALLFLSGWVRQRERLLFALLLLSIFVVEVKEPFIFKYAAPQVAMTLLAAGVARYRPAKGSSGQPNPAIIARMPTRQTRGPS